MKKGLVRMRMLPVWMMAVELAFTGCSVHDNTVDDKNTEAKRSIVILYENDVHCAIDGYAGYVGLRDAINRADTAYTGLVSAGDFLQGDLSGAFSKGQYIVDIMKHVGYDAITLGNHEFDYKVDRMKELLPQIGAPVVCSNFFEYGGTQPVYQPYVIKQYGDKRIAYIGTLTPETMNSEGYSFFGTTGKQLYDLRTNQVYSLVQEAVDKARGEGADYVVVLSHLGETKKETGIFSHGLIAATRGIDAVLDGHTHSVIPCVYVNNLDGKPVPISQTGTKFANVGKLWIDTEGKFSLSLINSKEIQYVNETVADAVSNIKKELDSQTSRVVAHTDSRRGCGGRIQPASRKDHCAHQKYIKNVKY